MQLSIQFETTPDSLLEIQAFGLFTILQVKGIIHAHTGYKIEDQTWKIPIDCLAIVFKTAVYSPCPSNKKNLTDTMFM
jgi:hypothetical protein